jgi:HAD superfamily hydrolase (TIGR01509 family)
MISINAEPFAAGVFDMDGVLLDSEPLHHSAVNQLLADEDRAPLSFEEYLPYMGTTDEYTWNDLIRRYRLQRPFAYYRERYDAVILDLYRRSSVLVSGAAVLLENLRGEHIRLAVASSSRSVWVETCLEALGVRDYFAAVVTGDMVTRSKPDPEIFLLAGERLGTPPPQCFAVEDSPKGVAAAVAAGMFTIAVATPYTRSSDTGAAQLRVQSLAQLDRALVRIRKRHSENGMRTI